MLTLNDGRSELWQWDTGRKLSVDADCSQVHFSNKVFGRSIDVDVVDGVAIIPDVLLQTDKDLNVWAFVGTAENGYTKTSKTFKVNRRNKPADYVFTPPDQTTIGELVERLGKIEESQDPDAIKNAVDDYLANNPIMVKETDPTVPEWAKYPTKPSYTAAEVGAQPAGNYLTEIEIKPVIEAANSAQALAKQADKKVDTLREVVSKFHSNIVEEAKGDIITLDDASDMELAGLTLYGKTTQNGTPTPDAPVPLESVGADGNVAVTVFGRQLFNYATCVNRAGLPPETYYAPNRLLSDYIPVSAGRYTIAFPAGITFGALRKFDKNKTYLSNTVFGDKTGKVNMTISNCDYVQLYFLKVDNSDISPSDVAEVMFNVGDTALPFESYKEVQTMTAQTLNGLPGIPVSSGGNYTDENGQMWICDEIDFARGKYVQRIVRYEKTFTIPNISTSGGLGFANLTDIPCPVNCVRGVLSNIAQLADGDNWNEIGGRAWRSKVPCFGTGGELPAPVLRFYGDVGSYNTSILVATDAPIEHDLTAEELAQYSVLHTNYPNTTIYNDEGAGMAVKYVVDTKMYIDNKFAELATAILNA